MKTAIRGSFLVALFSAMVLVLGTNPSYAGSFIDIAAAPQAESPAQRAMDAPSVAAVSLTRGGTALVTTASSAMTVSCLPSPTTFWSTTGARGRVCADSCAAHHCFYAQDTLTDGHCARWKVNGSWVGSMECNAVLTLVYQQFGNGIWVQICRTGVGNCSESHFILN